MYAIIKDSGTQIKVSQGDVIDIDIRQLTDDQKTLEFTDVLMIGDTDSPKIGNPLLKNAKVTADIIEEYRDDKITVIKFKKRKGYRRKNGHRQSFLKVKITDIKA